MIILAGNARSILDVLKEQVEDGAKLDGALSADECRKIATIKKAHAAIRAPGLQAASIAARPRNGTTGNAHGRLNKLQGDGDANTARLARRHRTIMWTAGSVRDTN